MGRIKSLMVKRTAKNLLANQENLFKEKFDENKKVLANTLPSKPIRNKIAGYMARLVKMKRILKEKEAKAASMPMTATAAETQ